MSKDKPKLPPLPKMRRLPSMPRQRPKDAALPPIPEPDEVQPSEDMYGIELGGTEKGRWFGTTQQDGSIGGTCARCGRKRKAENLVIRPIPFTGETEWVCKEGC